MTRALMAMAAFALIASPAFAQADRSMEFGAGYLNVMGTMHGWTAQISKPVSRHLSVLFEVNRSRGRECLDCDPVYNDLSVLGGVRYSWLGGRRITPSWQVLAGVLHSKSEAYSTPLPFGGTYLEDSYTVGYLAIQPGAGVTVMVTPRVGVRVQADLQFGIPDQSEYEGISVFPRVTVGAVVRLGR